MLLAELKRPMFPGAGSGRQAGFTLLEMLAVIVIATAVGAAFLWAYRQGQAQSEQIQRAWAQAQDMQTLAAAAQRYADTRQAATASGAMLDASPAALMAVNAIAANFAYRFGAAGTTPYGLSYKAAAVKDPITGNMQVMVWTVGSMQPAAAIGSGGAAQVAGTVETNLGALGARVPATVAANTAIATGQSNSFAIDVSQWVGSNVPTLTSPALLMNFAKLGGARPPPPPPPSGGSTCNLVAPTSSGVTACPSGYHSAATFPVCGSENPYVSMPWPVFGTTAGIVTYGFRHSQTLASLTSSYLSGCDEAFLPDEPTMCNGVIRPQDYSDTGEILLDGSVLGTDGICGGAYWHYTCPSNPSSPYMCQVQETNALVQSYKANAIENLCCKN